MFGMLQGILYLCSVPNLFSVMRKILLSMLVVVALTAQAQGEVRVLIESYLKENVNDASRLEIVSIGELMNDSVRTPLDDDRYKFLTEQFLFYSDLFHLELDNDDLDSAEKSLKDMQKYSDEVDKFTKEFRPYLRGKMAKVKYRATNKLGVLQLYKANVFFDTDVSVIRQFDVME